MKKISTNLKKELGERRARNTKYSLRAFARDLNISPTSLSRIMNNSREPSDEMIAEISKKLKIPLAKQTSSASIKEKTAKKRNLTPQYTYFPVEKIAPLMGWKFFAILELSQTRYFKTDIEWIAEKLNLSANDVKLHVDKLFEQKMLRSRKDGTWQISYKKVASAEVILNSATAEQRKALSELAAAAIETTESSLGKKHSFALTTSLDPDQLLELTQKIEKFFHEITGFLDAGDDKRQVYQLHFNYFPLSKVCP